MYIMNVAIDNNMMTSMVLPSFDMNLLKDLAKRFGWQILSTSKVVNHNEVSAGLQACIAKAREEYKRGETLHFESAEEMNAWLDSL